MNKALTGRLWGERAKLRYLMFASFLMLFSYLGGHDLWTQENRWAEIVSGMFYRHDFLHPYLGQTQYYDKPLLSYWLIALITILFGDLTTWTLRLPSVIAGLLAIFSIYKIGENLKDRQFGLLSGWLLLTTYYFVFWSRVSSADMLNLGGSLFAIAWYLEKRNTSNFYNYAAFFLIVALTSLCKGLLGAVVPFIAVIVDLCVQKSWRQHLTPTLFLSILPALVLYLLPFITSIYFGADNYQENGLYKVYRENILRYFEPFDHRDPIYTYFLYLPIYLLPFAIFLFIPSLVNLRVRWHHMSANSRWIMWVLISLFLFFTLSGSRRSYYVIPIVPFAILFIADWINNHHEKIKLQQLTSSLILSGFILVFFAVDVFPYYFYKHFGVQPFVTELQEQATEIKPWQEWQIILLDADTKIPFYLRLPPSIKNYEVAADRNRQTSDVLAKRWSKLLENHNAIFITRKRYEALLRPYFPTYKVISAPRNPYFSFLNDYYQKNASIAFVPPR